MTHRDPASTASLKRKISHPSPEELLGYHDGILDPEEHDRIQIHLAGCAQCASTVLDLATFPEIEASPGRLQVSEANIEASWRALTHQLSTELTSDGGTSPRAPDTRWGYFFDDLPRLRAAFLGLATVTAALLGGLLVSLQRSPSLQPQLNMPIIELAESSSAQPGVRTKGRPIPVPDDADGIVLVLTSLEPGTFTRLEVVLREATEPFAERWRSRELSRAPEGMFTLFVPAEFLGSGEYEIKISSLDSGSPESIATYAIDLQISRPRDSRGASL